MALVCGQIIGPLIQLIELKVGRTRTFILQISLYPTNNRVPSQVGLLPLPIPYKQWNHVILGWISQLPKTDKVMTSQS